MAISTSYRPAPRIEAGARFGATLAAADRRLAQAVVTLREPSEAVTGLLEAGGAPFAAEPPNGRDTEIAHLGPDDDGEFEYEYDYDDADDGEFDEPFPPC